MAKVTLKGNEVNTNGDLPAVGSAAPEFTLTRSDLSAGRLKDFIGTRLVLNIVPSLDTPTCVMTDTEGNLVSVYASTPNLCGQHVSSK